MRSVMGKMRMGMGWSMRVFKDVIFALILTL